jgi:hypothetical protein
VPRLVSFAAALALALAPASALAQSAPAPAPSGGNSPFSPLPPAQPTEQPAQPAPQPKPGGNPADDGPSNRSMLLLGVAGIAVIIAIGLMIGRDARKSLPRGHRPRKPGAKPARPEPPKVRRGHPAGVRGGTKAASAPKRRAKRRAR